MPAIVKLFADDAVWEMPPYTGWYKGPENIGRLIAGNCPATGPGDMVLVPTAANGQPAFAVYMRGDDGVHRAFQLHALTVAGSRVSHVTSFFDLRLFRSVRAARRAPAPAADRAGLISRPWPQTARRGA